MRPESKIVLTPSVTDCSETSETPSLIGHQITEASSVAIGRNAEKLIDIPVVVPLKTLDNTVKISVDLNNPPTYTQLVDKILIAVEHPVRKVFSANQWAALKRCFEHSNPGRLYFVWDFAPHARLEDTTGLGQVSPLGSGRTEVFGLGAREMGEYLHAAHVGRISYILVAAATADKLREYGFGEVKPAKVEPAKVEPAKVEPAKVEPSKLSDRKGPSLNTTGNDSKGPEKSAKGNMPLLSIQPVKTQDFSMKGVLGILFPMFLSISVIIWIMVFLLLQVKVLSHVYSLDIFPGSRSWAQW